MNLYPTLTAAWTCLLLLPSQAQDISKQREALQLVRDTAKDICYDIAQKSQATNIELSGEAQAQLVGVIKKIADLGIKGAAKYQDKQSEGVLQEELATTLQTSANCRKDVFDKLVEKLLPDDHSSAPTKATPSTSISTRDCSPVVTGNGNTTSANCDKQK